MQVYIDFVCTFSSLAMFYQQNPCFPFLGFSSEDSERSSDEARAAAWSGVTDNGR